MLDVAKFNCAEYHCAECHYAECCGTFDALNKMSKAHFFCQLQKEVYLMKKSVCYRSQSFKKRALYCQGNTKQIK